MARDGVMFEGDLGDGDLLEAVVAHYRHALAESPAALGWLQEHGIRNGDVLEVFGLGWSDRTLGLSLPIGARVAGRELRGRLQSLGVLRDSGHEQLRGCLVVPVRDEHGRVVQLYGHRVQRPQRGRGGEERAEVLWLPSPATALWHREAMSAAEVIVASSILDALVWWSAGYRNVVAPGGPDGLPDDLAALLVDAGVTRVLLAQPRTSDGEDAAAGLTSMLTPAGVECFRVVFPHGCDASTVAVEANDATDALGERLREATWLGAGAAPSTTSVRVDVLAPADTRRHERGEDVPVSQMRDTATPTSSASPLPPPPPGRDVEVDGGELRLTIGNLAWRARGLDGVAGPGSLRVNITVRDERDAFHLDVVDLYAARARHGFVKAAAMELGIDEERIRRDLGRVLLACEDRVVDLQNVAVSQTPDPPAMTASEEAAALDLLRDPQLLDRVVADVAALGVVGEQENALIAYLAATSRLLDTPLAVVVQSSSAAGKSTLTEAVLSLMPAEQRLAVSAMTGQSLYYLGEHELTHKVLSIAEAEGAARASYALKVLQSDGELSIASTGKDSVTGDLVTKTYRVRGPVALFLTTTAPSLDDELANRCVVLGVDEDHAQTRAILNAQRQAQTLDGLLAKSARDDVRSLHANAQRLLEPVAVVNPLAPGLAFGDGRTRARRDHAKLLTLIRAVALLHQHQRQRKRVTRGGVELVYIEATRHDVEVAERLAPLLFGGPSLSELAPQTRRLLSLLEDMIASVAKAHGCRREDVRFTRREAREHTGWSDFALRRHLDRLVDLELVLAHRRGNAFTYELLWAERTHDYDAERDGISRPSRGHLAVVARD